MAFSTRYKTFGDIISVISNRANIAGDVQENDLALIKGAVNEHYLNICTERNWSWRKFDRSFEFYPPETTGTVSVAQGSREVTFAGVTMDETWLGRTIQVDGTLTLYRIIGIDIPTDKAYLEANYIDSTNATATFKLYQYEFALPPDCDTICQVTIDGNLNNDKQLDEINNSEFNRLLSSSSLICGTPSFYTKDGQAYFNPTGRPLDVMILDYDFLGGNDQDKVEKLRIFPIWPDVARVIHLSYAKMVEDLIEDSQEPIIPFDDRSVLVHLGLHEWWKTHGNLSLAGMELRQAEKKLKEMRDEFHKTDTKPKMIVEASRYRRSHVYDRNIDLFRISRLNETT